MLQVGRGAQGEGPGAHRGHLPGEEGQGPGLDEDQAEKPFCSVTQEKARHPSWSLYTTMALLSFKGLTLCPASNVHYDSFF